MLDRMLACQQKCKTRAVSLTNHPWENLLRCTAIHPWKTYCAVRQSPRRPREPFSSGRRCKHPSACLITSVRWLAGVGSSTVAGWRALACCPAVARLALLLSRSLLRRGRHCRVPHDKPKIRGHSALTQCVLTVASQNRNTAWPASSDGGPPTVIATFTTPTHNTAPMLSPIMYRHKALNKFSILLLLVVRIRNPASKSGPQRLLCRLARRRLA